jgi:suppressor of fused-like protein
MQELNGKNSILTHLQRNYKNANGFVIEEQTPLKNPYLEEVLAYKNAESKIPHWHYITLGLSELYEKETNFEDISGFGIELSFRLLSGNEKTPPVWVKHFLENLAAYIFESSEGFEVYQCLDAGGVICQDVDTLLTAIAFIEDKQLKTIETPNGKLQFLQVIGLSQKELQIFAGDNYKLWLQSYLLDNPLAVTDLARKEILL